MSCHFAKNLKRLLNENEIVPACMMEDIGMSPHTYYGWLYGAIPRADVLIKIADYIGCTVDELIR